MFDLSFFMKELKQRFSTWHNFREKRNGPVWEDRFREHADPEQTRLPGHRRRVHRPESGEGWHRAGPQGLPILRVCGSSFGKELALKGLAC